MKSLHPIVLSLLAISALIVIGCSEEAPSSLLPEPSEASINLLAVNVNTANTEVTNINLKNGEQSSFLTDCMVLSSRVFDVTTKSIGYTSCDQTFVLVNPATGEQSASYPLPGPVNMAVVNNADHTLIGTYYDQVAEVNHIIRLDLDNGNLLSDLIVEDLGPMYTCTQFFDQETQNFSLISSDNNIVTIDASNGEVVSQVSINTGTNLIHYRESTRTLISITYDQPTDTNFVEKTDVTTGELLQKTALQSPSNFRLCAVGYDSQNNRLVTINSDNLVRYIDVDSGEVIDDLRLDTQMTPLTFYTQ